MKPIHPALYGQHTRKHIPPLKKINMCSQNSWNHTYICTHTNTHACMDHLVSAEVYGGLFWQDHQLQSASSAPLFTHEAVSDYSCAVLSVTNLTPHKCFTQTISCDQFDDWSFSERAGWFGSSSSRRLMKCGNLACCCFGEQAHGNLSDCADLFFS